VLQYHFNWKTLSAMAGVTWWSFYFRLFPGAIRSPQVILFLRHLLRHIPGKLPVVWDGLATHRSRVVWEFLRQSVGRSGGVPAGLRAGAESGRVSVVPLEAARAAQLLPGDVRSVEHSRPPGAAADASSADSGLRFLGTGRAVPVVISSLIASSWRTKVPFANPVGKLEMSAYKLYAVLSVWRCC